ncbi:MAG: large subunit ribosomal protein [Patescibacteria group bacterium]|nr:50S ribosomal protein L18 [Candidatus Saccharibacteria bacterium]MDQ5963445.1 large subunit ribosomal protein [Patescibacteria group bacterium]
MSLSLKLKNRSLRQNRIRAKVIGTTERPRLTVFISNTNVSAQIIDDTAHKTLVSITSVGSKAAKGTLTEKAAWVGAEIAAKAKAAKITSVVFDRAGRKYHGRVSALADAAREKGLEF